MTTAVLLSVAGLILLAGVEIVRAAGVLRSLMREDEPLPADEDCPRAAVILPLRGADPSLQACLGALLEQDYPDYTLHVVLDSEADPARPVVRAREEAVRDGRIRLHVLDEIPASCSLKCAGLAQVLEVLDDDVEVIALIDADGLPGRRWLRKLAGRLQKSGAGAVSGMRWFIPRGNGPSALLRYVWNAAAVVQMYRHGIAWGGSLAMRRELVETTDMLERLRHAYGEDTVLDRVLRGNGLELDFDPALVLVSREDVSFGGFIGWACRQLVSVRLHHGGWPGVVLFGLLQTFLVLACAILFVTGLWNGDPLQAGVTGLVLLGYELLQVVMLLSGESLVRKRAPEQYAAGAAPAFMDAAGLLIAIPLTQMLHGPLLIMAMLRRTVTWRGISYRIEGGGRIRMRSYMPYVQNNDSGNRSL